MRFREIRRCSTKSALELLPEGRGELDLDTLERALVEAGYAVTNAAVLLVANRADITETSVYDTGRVLVKSMDPREACRSAYQVLRDASGQVPAPTFEELEAAGRVHAA